MLKLSKNKDNQFKVGELLFRKPAKKPINNKKLNSSASEIDLSDYGNTFHKTKNENERNKKSSSAYSNISHNKTRASSTASLVQIKTNNCACQTKKIRYNLHPINLYKKYPGFSFLSSNNYGNSKNNHLNFILLPNLIKSSSQKLKIVTPHYSFYDYFQPIEDEEEKSMYLPKGTVRENMFQMLKKKYNFMESKERNNHLLKVRKMFSNIKLKLKKEKAANNISSLKLHESCRIQRIKKNNYF